MPPRRRRAAVPPPAPRRAAAAAGGLALALGLAACEVQLPAKRTDTLRVADTVVRVDTVVHVDTLRLAAGDAAGLGEAPPEVRGESGGEVAAVDSLRRGVAAPATPPAGTPAPGAPTPGASAPSGAPAPATTGAAAAPGRTEVSAADLTWLRGRRWAVPVTGVAPEALRDSYTESRGAGRPHDAIDIAAPRGTPVVAADDGQVLKLFESRGGGHTVYVLAPGGRFVHYYAHLDAYRPGLAEGQPVRRGDQLGTVGASGNARPDAPHLHFAVARLDDPKRWWDGTPVNPFPLLRQNAAAR